MSSDDEEEEFNLYIENKLKKYLGALKDFVQIKESIKSNLTKICQKSEHDRLMFAFKFLNDILWKLSFRPKEYQMEDEEFIYLCEALVLGWDVCNDCYDGLGALLIFFEQDIRDEDIIKINEDTIQTLKKIAVHENFYNSPFGGGIYRSNAKTILSRYNNGNSFEDNTTLKSVRFMKGLYDDNQPKRKNNNIEFDQRKICHYKNCSKIESKTKFQMCSRCKLKNKCIYYCGVECQKKDWDDHKKICNN
jgi:hypothetical protein